MEEKDIKKKQSGVSARLFNELELENPSSHANILRISYIQTFSKNDFFGLGCPEDRHFHDNIETFLHIHYSFSILYYVRK